MLLYETSSIYHTWYVHVFVQTDRRSAFWQVWIPTVKVLASSCPEAVAAVFSDPADSATGESP